MNYDDDDRAQLVDNVRDAVGQVEDAQLLLRIDVFSALVAGAAIPQVAAAAAMSVEESSDRSAWRLVTAYCPHLVELRLVVDNMSEKKK